MATVNNKTLKFYGSAYGETAVTLKAVINGTTVFEGEVPTINTPIPTDGSIEVDQLLFTLEDCSLFPSDFGGSYPMSIQVTNGYGAVFSDVQSNWMPFVQNEAYAENCTISGTTLTIGTLRSGTIIPKLQLIVKDFPPVTCISSKLGDDSANTWVITNSLTYSGDILFGRRSLGMPNIFRTCYKGTPANSEGTPDFRSSVQIDGHQQVPPLPKSIDRTWTWTVPSGSTISYQFTVSAGTPASP